MRTRHTLDLARWRAAVSELRKVLRMAKSVPLKCPRNLKRQPLHRFSLKQSDGTFALSVSEIAEVFADDLENWFTPYDFARQEDRTTISRLWFLFGPPNHIKRLASSIAPVMDKIDDKVAKSLPNSVIAQLCLLFKKGKDSCSPMSHGPFLSGSYLIGSWILTRLVTLYQTINMVSVVATQLLNRFTESWTTFYMLKKVINIDPLFLMSDRLLIGFGMKVFSTS